MKIILIDLMLANGEEGFSCGEVAAYFRPWRSYHYNPPCGCGNPKCEFWQNIDAYGESKVYEAIFNQNPKVNFIVDSSKDLSWIYDQ